MSEGSASDCRDQRRIDRAMDSLQARLPPRAARLLGRLRLPSAVVWRLLAAFLLMLGGIFSFLPVLGIWMLPLGFLLLAYDVPILKRPAAWCLVQGQALIRRWRRR